MEVQNREIIGLWVDDIRVPPEFWYKGAHVQWMWAKDVESAKYYLQLMENKGSPYSIISIDHDAGEFGPPDYIKVLDWLEKTGRNYPIRIHSMNPVGVANMRAIIQRNGWMEVK